MVRERDPKFYNELKQLNEDLVKFLKTTHEKSPYFDLCPTLNDYIRQFNELERQYPEKETNTFSTVPSSIPTNSSNLSASALPFAPQKQQPQQPLQLPATATATSTTLSFKSTSNNISFGASANNNNNNSSSNNNTDNNAAPKLTPFAPLPSVGTSIGGVSSFSFGTALSSAAPVFSFSSSSTTTTTSSAMGGLGTGTNFSSAINAASNLADNPSSTIASPFESSTRPQFLFGSQPNTQITTSSTSAPAPTSLFSFSMAKKEEDDAKNSALNAASDATDGNNKDNQDDDATPPQPQIDKFEEPDAMYSVRCKFYEKSKKSTGELSLMGFGMLYVKSMDTKTKLQVIVRQEPNLRRLLLNEVITPSIPLKQLPKAVQMVFPGLNGENKIYLAKVKDEKDASELFELLNSVKNVSS